MLKKVIDRKSWRESLGLSSESLGNTSFKNFLIEQFIKEYLTLQYSKFPTESICLSKLAPQCIQMADVERSKNGEQLNYLCAEGLQLDTLNNLPEPYMIILLQAGEGEKYLPQDAWGSWAFLLD